MNMKVKGMWVGFLVMAWLLLTRSATGAQAATQSANVQVTTQPSNVNLDTIGGMVRAVSMTTVSSPEDYLIPSAPTDPSEEGPRPAVIIELEGQDHQAFIILTSEIVKLEGFKDLAGATQHPLADVARNRRAPRGPDARIAARENEFTGGLMILAELQNRLVGAEIVVKCRKIAQEGLPQLLTGSAEGTVYAIATISPLNQDQTRGQGLTQKQAPASLGPSASPLVAGSGVEYRWFFAGHEQTEAIVFLGQEAGGYWMERRSSFENDGHTTVTKELMVGDPPQSTRRIMQMDGQQPIETRKGGSFGAWLNSGTGRFFLDVLGEAVDTMQTDIANREIPRGSKPIPSDEEKLRAASRESKQIPLPPQPIMPALPDTSAPVDGASVSLPAPTEPSPPAQAGASNVPLPAPTATRTRRGGMGGRTLAKVGTESVTVPAGTFECDHYTYAHRDFWISSKLSQFGYHGFHGLVKRSSPSGDTIVLQKVFEHETSQIKGKVMVIKVPNP